MMPLSPDDFPLIAVGACVYRRMMSSPVFTALDSAMAADLAFRLNRDHFAAMPLPASVRIERTLRPDPNSASGFSMKF